MNDFTASNGTRVRPTGGGMLTFSEDASPRKYSAYDRAALREFFRAEEDERLGRWRWPENPDYVVYAPRPGFHVLGDDPCDLFIVNEMWGSGLAYVDAEFASYDEHDAPFAAAGRAYFDAHPEPKPWHDANEGDVWIITLLSGNTYPAIFQAGRFRDHGGSWDAADITDARRIWPEVSL